MRRLGKKNLKIVAACSVAIFSLFAALGAVYAWFVVAMKQTTNDVDFAVVNVGTCDLYSMELIKFDYRTTVYGEGDDQFIVIDYLSPETGAVNKYGYNKDEGSFGYDESGTWHKVDMMNTYDPVDLLIYGGDVKDMNCNSIYKFVVSSDDLLDVSFDAFASKIIGKEKEDDELFLTSCTDFDIYFDSDIDDSNPLLNDKVYYPSYIDHSQTLSENEDVYYKISYLSSLESSHSHFYDSEASEVSLIGDASKSFIHDDVTGKNYFTFYVNVNYASSELESTMTLIYQRHIKSICDFGFKFYFVGDEGE